jgi:glycosyltransferase involved in cell wall biosynthesis
MQIEGRNAISLSVLYVHPIGAFGGASRSLLELVRALPRESVQPRVIAPRGQVSSILRQSGIPILTTRGISQFDCTRFGYYRGWRWIILLREIYFLPFTLWGMLRARRKWGRVDVVHVNEITAVVPAVLAKAIFRAPLVVHVRSVQQTEGIPWRRRFLTYLLQRYADAVIAIDATVRAGLPSSVHAVIVHNGFTPVFAENTPPTVAALKQRFHSGSLRVGLVGNLLSLKGVYDFLEAARLCIRSEVNADFVIVGSNTRRVTGLTGTVLSRFGFAQDVEADVQRFTAENGLEERVSRLPFMPEISAVYQLLDLLCFPSHLDAVGRPVLEAAWFSVPSIVAVDRPSSDTFIDGVTGIRIRAQDPTAIAEVIRRLSADRSEVRQLGQSARRLAEKNFDSGKNAVRILEIYRRVQEAHT